MDIQIALNDTGSFIQVKRKKLVESMNAKFLELDVVDPIVPSDDIDVNSLETISLPLPIPIFSVSIVVSIETGVPIFPVETIIAIGDIVDSQANDMLDLPTANESAQPVE